MYSINNRLGRTVLVLVIALGLSGPGHAQGVDVPDSQRGDRSEVFCDASRLLTEAVAQMRAENWLGANASLVEGIRVLGDDYRPDGVLDDTGQRVAVAKQNELDGRLSIAANLRETVLSTRLKLFTRKFSVKC